MVRKTRRIHLMEKKNGKIVKNEEYDIYTFMDLVFPVQKPMRVALPWWMPFKSKIRSMFKVYAEGVRAYYYMQVMGNINKLIDRDNYGKSHKKK